MKTTSILGLLLACTQVLCAQRNLTLGGNITGLPASQKRTVVVDYYAIDKWTLMDSTFLHADGSFKFRLRNCLPGNCRFRVWGNNKAYADFIVPTEPADSMLRLNTTFAELSAKTARIGNSRENEAYAKLLNINAKMKSEAAAHQSSAEAQSRFIAGFNRQFEQLAGEYPETFTGQVLCKLYCNPTRYDRPEWVAKYPDETALLRAEGLSAIDFSDKRLLYHAAFKEVLDTYYKNAFGDGSNESNREFIRRVLWYSGLNDNVGNFLYLYLLKRFNSDKNEDAIAYLLGNFTYGCGHSDSEGGSGEDAVEVDPSRMVNALKAVTPGNQAHNIALPDQQDKMVNLSEVYPTAKVTIVYFWRTSCSHCMEFKPELEKIYAKYHDKGLQVYAVSIDKQKQDWLHHLSQHASPWVNVWADKVARKEVGTYYPAFGTPLLIAVGADGKVITRMINHHSLEDYLKGILN